MRDKAIRKLKINKETLRELNSKQLTEVAAGMANLTFQPLCAPSGATWFAPCDTYRDPCGPPAN